MVQRAVKTEAVAGRFRHYPRQPVRLRAVLAHPVAGWQREIDVVDLGIGGAGIEGIAAFELAEGDRLAISFHAPMLWDPLTLTARIAWARPELGTAGKAGVAFEHKSPQSVYALFEMLASYS